jgi:hypothetical protein
VKRILGVFFVALLFMTFFIAAKLGKEAISSANLRMDNRSNGAIFVSFRYPDLRPANIDWAYEVANGGVKYIGAGQMPSGVLFRKDKKHWAVPCAGEGNYFVVSVSEAAPMGECVRLSGFLNQLKGNFGMLPQFLKFHLQSFDDFMSFLIS